MISILYVDDEPTLLDLGKIFLEKDPRFSVDIACSAFEALEKLKHRTYNAIVSDYQMPNMNGIEFLKKVRSSGNKIPFIIFTGRGREEIVIQALNEGADYYLQKGGEPQAQFTELKHKICQAVQQRRSEMHIRDLERREADIINFLPDATFAIDTNGVVIAWNHAMEKMTGIRAAEILGKGDYVYSIPFYHERRPVLIDLVLHGELNISKKYPFVIREGTNLISEGTIPDFNNGKGVTLWFIASPLFDNQGNVVGAIESIRDITERTQAKAALAESEERYRYIVEDQTEFICRFTPDGKLTFVNDAYCRYFGLDRNSCLNKPHTVVIPPDDLSMMRQHLRSLSPEKPVAVIEHRIIMPSGEVRWQNWSDRAIFDNQGHIIEYQSVGRDTTDRKETEENLARLNEDLHAAYEQLTATEEELRQNYEKINQSQQELRSSEGRYRNVVEDQTEFISRFLPDGTHVFVNEAYCRYFKKNREDIIGKLFSPEIPTEDQEAVRKHFVSLVPGHPVAEIRHRIIMPNGEVRWQRWSDRAIFNAAGTIVEYQSVGRDITEIIQTEEALRESEERYRQFFRTVRDCMYITTEDGRWIDLNDAAVELFGYSSREELMQVRIPDLYTNPEDRIKHLNLIAEQGYLKEFPVDLKRKDGFVISTLITSIARYDSKGEVIGFQGTIRDITAQKRMEEALRESERRLLQILDFLPDATFAIDSEGRVIAWSHTMEEMTGVPASEMLGKGDYEYALPFYGVRRPILIDLVLSPDDEIRRKYSFVYVDGDVLTAETETASPRGKKVILWGKAVPLYDIQGKVIGAIESIRDITGLRLSTEALVQANQKMNLLSSITRHDVLNKISIGLGFVAIARKRTDDKDTLSAIAKVERAIIDIRTQIEFTKVYQEVGIHAPQWQNIGEILSHCPSSAPPVAMKAPGTTEIFADPMLPKVFSNLMENTIRHGEKATQVVVTAIENEEGLVLGWEDDGVGVPTGEKERIFERGYGRNTGLGLFLVREILAITGITIKEIGEPGKGARFEIHVPRVVYRFMKNRIKDSDKFTVDSHFSVS